MDNTSANQPHEGADVSRDENAATHRSADQATVAAAVNANGELPQPHLGWVTLTVVGFLGFQLFVGVAIALAGIALFVAQSELPLQESMRQLPRAADSPATQQMMIFAASASTCVFAFAVAALAHGSAVGRRLAMRWPSLWQTLLVLLLFLPVAIVVSEINNWLLPVVPSFGLGAMEQAMQQMSRMPLPLMVIAVCVFPAVGEELLFRGFIGRGLVGRYGPLAGVAITSALFGAIHIHPVQAISAGILGVVLHVVYLWTKSLLAPILLHFLNNLFAMLCMRYRDVIPIPGVSIIGQEQVIHTPVAITLASAAATCLLLGLLFQSRSRWRSAEGAPWSPGYVTAEEPADARAQLESPTPNLAMLSAAIALYGGLLWLLNSTIQHWRG